MLKYFGLLLIFVVSTLGARIVGGGDVDIRQHPYQVSLQLRKRSGSFTHQCGGSIIRANRVLTAAHCIENNRAKDFIIAAGSSNLKDPNAVKVRVWQIYVHARFNETSYENDVALVYLSNKLPINNVTIATIALATKVAQPGWWASATGWGATVSGGKISNKLLQVNVPIISNDRCDALYTLIYNYSCITSDMICAGYDGVGGKDSCEGDSGGPLTYLGKLIGVVSWGKHCARPDAPGVYASVPHFKNWIRRYLQYIPYKRPNKKHYE